MKLQKIIPRLPILRSALVAVMTLAFFVEEARAQVVAASIAEYDPDPMNPFANFRAERLRALLDDMVPPASTHSTLLIFSHCFGGEALASFIGRAKTTVLSATSPGDVGAVYGYYHKAAALALYPAQGRTSTDVHAAGVAARGIIHEHPMSIGPVASLEPTPLGGILRRYVLYYAGRPLVEAAGSDFDDRDVIRANFFTDGGAFFRSSGGRGLLDGFDYEGTFVGMCEAIKKFKATLPMDLNTQFILFIGDHGDLHKSKSVTLVGGTGTSGQLTLGTDLYNRMVAVPDNVPRVSILSPGPTPPGPVTVIVDAAHGSQTNEVNFPKTMDLNHDDDLLDPGEGLVSVIALDESMLDASGVNVTVMGPLTLTQVEVDLGSGAIPRLSLPPRIEIGWEGTNVMISWGAAAKGSTAESSLTLGAGAVWLPVPGVPNPITSAGSATVNPTSPAAFFRLRK